MKGWLLEFQEATIRCILQRIKSERGWKFWGYNIFKAHFLLVLVSKILVDLE